MSKLGKRIIQSLKEFGDALFKGDIKQFDSREEAQAWKDAHPEYDGIVAYSVAKPTRVDQVPPKPYNAVVEPTED